jgi:hypothetical protein
VDGTVVPSGARGDMVGHKDNGGVDTVVIEVRARVVGY